MLALTTQSTDGNERGDHPHKVNQIRGLIKLLNAFLKGGYYTDAVLPEQSIESLKLAEMLTDKTVK